MVCLNLGILAHVDAGKTSLTERLLYAAGVIDEVGSVDAGSTTTDSLALERQRGITIKSAVVSFAIGGRTVNLIDTPGHPDFIAEVERVLSVLDGAVLVISAVEGVQAQTRVLLRTLRRLRIPTLIFVNKIDRRGAQFGSLLDSISEKLTPAIVPMATATDVDILELLAEHDDALLAAYVADDRICPAGLRKELAVQAGRGLVHPVFFGSAITGTGIDELSAGIRELLPVAAGDPDGPVQGSVFKIERGPAGEKIAYARMFQGTVHNRDRLRFGDGREGKVTAVSVFAGGRAERRQEVVAGEIGLLWGLTDIRIGDVIGTPRAGGERHFAELAERTKDTTPGPRNEAPGFAPPTLETVVVPSSRADRGRLHLALRQLAEQDPLINLRQDDLRQEVSVSLYGEVQKEVIQATLADDFGVDVGFRETTTICVERPAGTGAAVEIIDTGDNPFLATVGLRVEPGEIGAGTRFRLEVELGSMPYAFFKAVQEGVEETLRQGIHGWEVLDCVVTMTHSGYWAKQSHAHAVFDKSMSSTAGDFRNLTPMVLMSALADAGTAVYEPMHRFTLDLPADTFAAVQAALVKLRAVPRLSTPRRVSGEIPADRVHELQRQLPSLTRGEGVLETEFDHYQQVRGPVPARPRTNHNPLNRKEYVLHLTRLR